jgi:glycerate kinase
MNLLIAPDSFKGCLTSEEVCAAIAKGAIIADPNINIKQNPSSDGGEGFCSSMKNIFGGE